MTGRRLLLLATTTLMPLSAGLAVANPLGGQVVAGSATIQGQGTSTVTVTQTSQNAVINWNTFNIGPGQTTQFIQPNSNSIVLDRVTGGQGPSQIFGSLVANGIVFLVNPNGILFGKDAQVNVGGLLATTHDISNGDFMAGRYNFSISGNPTASVVNQGSITAASGGFAALVAPGVRNSGVITATLGTVGLAAGNGFTLDLYGDKLITLAPSDVIAKQVVDVATGKPLSSLVTNTGKLSANGGRVQITAAAAKAIVNSVINTTGVIEANSIGQHNGKIVLGAATAKSKPADAPAQTVTIAGKLSASGKQSGTSGGTIQVTGENIVLAGATVDASGKAGGGTVLIGGDVGGGAGNAAVAAIPQAALQPYAVPTATTVSIDAGSTITASAAGSGNGGKVVVWSDQLTSFAGAVKATGGPQGGNGGFVETSSHGVLNYTGTVDVSAPAGAFGTLLLDPYNVTITAGPPAGRLPSGTFTPTSNDSTLTAGTLTKALATANVVVTTGSGGSQAGNITVAAPVNWSSGGSLTLSAYNNVIVNASIVNSGAAAVTLRADSTGTGNGTVIFGTGGTISTAGPVTIFYNPSVNPAGSVVNATSYVNPTENYAGNVSGGGTVTAYMLVNSVYDLQNVQNNLGGTYALGRNIDASATAGWNGGAGFIPIGGGVVNDAASVRGVAAAIGGGFTGTLDGGGHTVDGLTIKSGAPSLGLFASIGGSGTVANLNLTNVNISGTSPNAQQIGGIAGYNAGTIRSVTVSGTVSALSDNSFVGGVAGINTGSLLRVSANVTASANNGGDAIGDNDAGPSYVGGLVGYNTGTIDSSQAAGTVSTGSASFAGGIAGYNSGVISSSLSTAAVSAYPQSNFDENDGPSGFGGLVGQNDFGGRIVNSAASGPVEGGTFPNYVGGLVGWNSGTVTQAYATGSVSGAFIVGGLIGYNNGTITQTYAIGAVTARSPESDVGGLVGRNDEGGNVTSSFWNLMTTGLANGAGANFGIFSATGLTTAQMQDASTFQAAGWNFQTVWLPPNQATGSFPLLRALTPNVPPVPNPPSQPQFPNIPQTFGVQQIATLIAPPLGPTDLNSFTLTPIKLGPPDNPGGGPGGGPGDGSGAGGAGSGNNGDNAGPGFPGRAGGNGAPPGTRLIDMAVIPLPPGSGMPPPGETRFVADEVVFQIGNQFSAQQVADIAARFGLTVIAAEPITILGRSIYTFRIPDGRSVRDIIRLIEANRVGGFVQPNYLYEFAQEPAAVPNPAATFTDSLQYVVGKLQLAEAHRFTRGDNVVVAVIDSAIDADHPDLAGAVTSRFDAGCDGAAPSAHGTGMTGAIAAHRTLTGIAPNVKIIAICAFGGDGASAKATSIRIIKAIDYAVSQGARIINMSFAGPRDPSTAQTLQIASEKGIVLIAAAGNAGPKSPPLYPGADPNVIAVTATDQRDRLFSGANQGKYIAVAAPGVDILVPAPDGRAQLTTGTSVAAAEVSGVAALLIAQNPRRTPHDIRTILMSTAKDLGPKGFDPQFGAGLVDPIKALQYPPRLSLGPAPASAYAQNR